MSTHFALALHIMALLATWKKIVTSREIARSVNTNPAMIRRLMQKLVHAKLVKATEGKNGGFELVKKPENIRLSEIFVSLEEPLFATHASIPDANCPCGSNIIAVVDEVFAGSQQMLTKHLKDQYLSAIVKNLRKRNKTELPI